MSGRLLCNIALSSLPQFISNLLQHSRSSIKSCSYQEERHATLGQCGLKGVLAAFPIPFRPPLTQLNLYWSWSTWTSQKIRNCLVADSSLYIPHGSSRPKLHKPSHTSTPVFSRR